MSESPKTTVKYKCRSCKSYDILFDAWASWNPEKNTCEIDEVFDAAYCNVCENMVYADRIEENDR